MAQRPTGKSTGKPAGKGTALHAPLADKRRPHDDVRMDPREAAEGAKRAKAEMERRARKSAWARMAPLIALPIIILIMVGTYTYLWFSAASGLKDFAHNLQATQDGDGWKISAEEPKVNGFPLSVGVSLTNVEIIAPERWGGWQWRAEHVQLSADAWNQDHPRIAPVGHSQLRSASGALFDLSAEQALLTLGLDSKNQIDALTLVITKGVAQPVGGAPPLQISSLTAAGAASALPLSPPPDAHTVTYEGSLALRDTVIPAEMAPTIGPMVRELQITGRLLGPLGEGSLREKLTKWRDDGGVAEIDRAYIDWSPLKMVATGTLALDDRMQPVGALSSQIQGFFEAVNQLYAAKVMRARDATLARVMMGTMSEMKGGVPTITTPISLQAGGVILGPVTVMELPTIQWPGPAKARELPSLRPSYEVDRWGHIIRQD